MSCQYYQPRKCWKHSELADANITCLGDCTKCSFGNFDAVPSLATIRAMYAEHASTRCRPATAKDNLRIFDRFIDYMGGGDVKAIFDEELPTRYIQSLKANGLSDQTIKSYLETMTAVFGVHACESYKRKGKVVLPFPKYDFKAAKVKWVSLTREQRAKIRQYQFDCYNLTDPRKYLAVTGAWERGARKSDVLRFHWSKNFIERDGVMWWCYTTNKTHKLTEWPIDPDTWMMLCEARRKLASLRVQHLGSYPDSYLRVRDFADTEMVTSDVWNECGSDLRRIMGWDGAKAMHNLRKDGTDQVYQNMGIDEACEFSSDTEKIIRDHYAGKKRIDPRTISIAKM